MKGPRFEIDLIKFVQLLLDVVRMRSTREKNLAKWSDNRLVKMWDFEIDVQMKDFELPWLGSGHVNHVELLLIVLEEMQELIGDVGDEVIW